MKQVNIYEEASRCLLCQEAPCTIACKTGDPARAIRAIRFDNHKLATQWVAECSDADLEAAEAACIRYDWPIRLKEMLRSISPDDVTADYPNLEIDFCGIPHWTSHSVVFVARILSFWLRRRSAPTMKWWLAPLMRGGLACTIRLSAYKISKRCLPVSMPFTTVVFMVNSMDSAIWNN